MKTLFILFFLISIATNVSAGTKTFYLRFKGQTDAEALDKVDEAIPGLKSGKFVYEHQRVSRLYSSRGCDFTRPKYVSLKAVTVKKAYRVNRHGELESFQQATVKLAHKRCTSSSND